MRDLLLGFPGQETLAYALAQAASADCALLRLHYFPSGEALVTLPEGIAGRRVLLACSLPQPDPKLLPLLFAADCARDLGASVVGLVAPYLAYLRQDARFHAGEAITSRTFATVLSRHLDFLVTVDPHLHRYAALADLYPIPAVAVSAAPALADWIARKVPDPLLIGPDQESEQWVSAVATRIQAPYAVLGKRRQDEFHVAVSLPDLSEWQGRTPVLVDDIIETAQTMIAATTRLVAAGFRAPVCLGVHALFAGPAFYDLEAAGAARIVTCDTVAHFSNGLTVVPLLAQALRRTDTPPSSA